MSNRKPGRPIKFQPEYCEELIEYFSRPLTYEKEVTTVDKKGIAHTSFMEVANPMPKFYEFADSIGVDRDTLLNWAKDTDEAREMFPGFHQAYEKAKELQKWFLIENALHRRYDAYFAKFVAINITDMRDKSETELSSNVEKPLTIRVVKDSHLDGDV